MKTAKLAIAAAFAVGTIALGQAHTVSGPQDRSVKSENSAEVRHDATADMNKDRPVTMDKSSAKLSDSQFVKEAATGGLYEIESAKLASQKLEGDWKEHAKAIEKDHKTANDELKRIAQKKDIVVPATLDAKHQQMLSDLRKSDKDQFQSTFSQQQIDAHNAAIDLFQRASTDLQDPDLKQFAQKQLPALQRHLAMLQGGQPGMAAQKQSDVTAEPAGATIKGDNTNVQRNRGAQPDPELKDRQSGYETHSNPGTDYNPDVNR